MIDIKLDPVSHDLFTVDNDLVLVDGADALVQNLKIRLWTFFGEWFLNTSSGLRYFEDILVKNPNLPRVEILIKAIILETDEVNQLLEFDFTYDARQRSASVSFTVDTIYGPLSINDLNLGV